MTARDLPPELHWKCLKHLGRSPNNNVVWRVGSNVGHGTAPSNGKDGRSSIPAIRSPYG